MKTINSLWVVGVSILTLLSCNKEPAPAPVPSDPKDVKVKITAEYPSADQMTLNWNNEAESIQFIEAKSNDFSIKKTESVSIADNVATFELVLPYDKGNEFNYWAVAPATSLETAECKDLKSVKLNLNAVQSSSKESFDHNADLIISKKVSQTSQPSELKLEFSRPLAIVEMNLEGIAEGEKISEITFSTTSTALAGSLAYNLIDNAIVSFDGSKEICLNGLDLTASAAGNKVYFTAFPVELTDYSVVVKTDLATYSKEEKSIGKLSLKQNAVNSITVKEMDRNSVHKILFPTWNDSQEQSYEGGEISIDYTLENPAEGAVVKTSTSDVDFIKNLKAENGKITFELAANTAEQVKEYTISVEYVKGTTILYTTAVKVKQAAKPAPPVLSITWDKTIELDAEGGSFSAPYSIENPVNGAELAFSSMYGYVKNPKAENGKITFTLDANPDQEIRKDYLTVEYKKGNKTLTSESITVKQAAKKATEMTFNLKLDKIETDGVYIYLTPSDLNATYVVETVEKAIFDNMTEDAYIKSRIDEWKSYYEPISNHLTSGEQSWVKIPCKNQGTLYYVVVYGLNEDGTRTTTTITKAEFKSATPVLTPKIKIDINTWDNSTSPRPEDNKHYDVTVNIENPASGTELKATTDVTWIKNLTVTKVSEDKYTVSFDTGRCKHIDIHKIKLTYGSAKARYIELY